MGRKRKWGWPTGTGVICSVLTENDLGFKTLHGSGSQLQVRKQKANASDGAAAKEPWFPGDIASEAISLHS